MSRKLLIFIAWIHIVGGLALPFAVQFEGVQAFIVNALKGTAAEPGSTFWIGVFGPTVASWGLLFLALLHSFFNNPTHEKWKILLGAVLIWCVIDTSYCLALGVTQALVTNVPAALFLVMSLWKVRGMTDE